MSDKKREAEVQLSPEAAKRRSKAHLVEKPTIDTLEPWPLTVTASELAPGLLPEAFGELNRGRQHLDLWTILTAPYYDNHTVIFNDWLRLKEIKPAIVAEWKHGREVSLLQKRQPTGAKAATRIIKTLRRLDGEFQTEEMRGLRMAVLQMELDYIMLLYGTNAHVVDHMIPHNKQRVAYLLRVLSSQASGQETVVNPRASEAASEGHPQLDIERTVMGFRQDLNPDQVPLIVGYEDVIEMLDDLLEIPQLFQHLVKRRSRVGFQGILLFGPPGTGKTLLAQTLATKRNLAFFKVPADQLISKWVGDTEKYGGQNFQPRETLTALRLMQTLFRAATANAPAVVFFDEIDYLTRSRTEEESSFDRRIKNQLLSLFSELLSNSSVLLMGATNRPWQIDSAFLSRFQQRLFIDLPDNEVKLKMLELGLEHDTSKLTKEDRGILNQLLESSEFSGRDIEAALAKVRFEKLRQLKKSSCFAPAQAEGLWEPCSSSHPLAKHQPFKDWSIETLVPSPITFADLSATLSKMKVVTTVEERRKHQDWAKAFGTVES